MQEAQMAWMLVGATFLMGLVAGPLLQLAVVKLWRRGRVLIIGVNPATKGLSLAWKRPMGQVVPAKALDGQQTDIQIAGDVAFWHKGSTAYLVDRLKDVAFTVLEGLPTELPGIRQRQIREAEKMKQISAATSGDSKLMIKLLVAVLVLGLLTAGLLAWLLYQMSQGQDPAAAAQAAQLAAWQQMPPGSPPPIQAAPPRIAGGA